MFPNIQWEYNGTKVVGADGMGAWNLNLVTAIERCRELVDHDDTKISVDILNVITEPDPTHPPQPSHEKYHTLENWVRYQQIRTNRALTKDVYDALAIYPEVNFRHYVGPSQHMPVQGFMDATNATCTWPMQLLGRKDGKQAVTGKGPDIFAKMREHRKSKELQTKWPRIETYVSHLLQEHAAYSKDKPFKFDCSFIPKPDEAGRIEEMLLQK